MRKSVLRGIALRAPVCPDGHLQAKGQFTFKDGTFLPGSVLRTCKGR
jgi:hypothetical protein